MIDFETMSDPKPPVDRVYARIRKNPVVASLVILGSIVIALSTFTNASRNLLSVFDGDTRSGINGQWTAEVEYDWENAKYLEKFTFRGEDDDVYGTASFLGRDRSILEGEIINDKLHFVTISGELSDTATSKDIRHEYRGRISGNEIKLVLQSRGGSSRHVPVELIARKVPEQENQ